MRVMALQTCHAVLAMALPAGAAVWGAAGFDNGWSMETHMLASVADVLVGANWQRAGGKGPKPAPLPRPGDEARVKSKTAAVMSQAAKFKARQREAAPDER